MDGPSYTREMRRMWWTLAAVFAALLVIAFLFGYFMP